MSEVRCADHLRVSAVSRPCSGRAGAGRGTAPRLWKARRASAGGCVLRQRPWPGQHCLLGHHQLGCLSGEEDEQECADRAKVPAPGQRRQEVAEPQAEHSGVDRQKRLVTVICTQKGWTVGPPGPGSTSGCRSPAAHWAQQFPHQATLGLRRRLSRTPRGRATGKGPGQPRLPRHRP